MDINHAALEVFFRDLNTQFSSGFNSGSETSVLSGAAMTMPSVTSATAHAWLNQLPNLREWLGDRVVSNLVEGVRGVGDKLSQEDLLVGVEGVDDQ